MRGRTSRAALGTLLLCLIATTAAAETKLQQLTRESTFVFAGTVIDHRDGVAKVRVDTIVRASEFFKDLAGKEVRVRVQRAAEKGDRAVFFTRGASMGADLVLEELARFTDPQPEAIAKLLEQTANEMADEVLLDRLKEVDLVIAGRVTAIRSFRGLQPQPFTEHDPQWQEAIVTVLETLKGNANIRRVSILVPTTTDVMFRNTPRLRVQQEGVFLLKSTEAMKLLGSSPNTYTALDSIDVQPISALERLRLLVARAR